MLANFQTVIFILVLLVIGWLPASMVFGAEKNAEKKEVSPDKVIIATVGKEKITLKDLNEFIDRLPENVQRVARLRKAEMLENLVNRHLIFEYAKAKNYDQKNAVKDYMIRAHRAVMIQVAVEEIEKSAKPTEKELKEEYQKSKQKFQEGGKVTASHIMVASEKEAKDLITKLEKGDKFDELAKKYSIAPERENGGSLGTITRGHHKTTGLPVIIEQTAFSLDAGAHSGVVRSQFGWHVVYASKKEDARQMSFEEARPKIEKEMGDAKRSKAVHALLSRLENEYKVKKFPDRVK
jgi:peptidyl-prolyl cis-trans isomerase C